MRYRVYGKYVEYGHIDIDAESKKDAYEKAESTDAAEWEIDECGYFEIGECEEV